MIRHLLLAGLGLVLGAALMLAVRAARHRPEAMPAPAEQGPHAAHPAASAAPPAPAASASAALATVNTICPICGMPVDPRLPVAEYRGARIGFGCAACPPEFARDPERFGPAALADRTAED